MDRLNKEEIIKNKEEIRKKKLIERKDINTSYKSIFKTEQGKKVLEDLSYKCYYNNTTFSMEMMDKDVFFREGRRSIYLYIIDQIDKIID